MSLELWDHWVWNTYVWGVTGSGAMDVMLDSQDGLRCFSPLSLSLSTLLGFAMV